MLFLWHFICINRHFSINFEEIYSALYIKNLNEKKLFTISFEKYSRKFSRTIFCSRKVILDRPRGQIKFPKLSVEMLIYRALSYKCTVNSIFTFHLTLTATRRIKMNYFAKPYQLKLNIKNF